MRRPISFLEVGGWRSDALLEGAGGDAGREAGGGGEAGGQRGEPATPATLVQVEEERRQRVRMGWCLALSQGTLLAVLFLLWKKTYMNGPS